MQKFHLHPFQKERHGFLNKRRLDEVVSAQWPAPMLEQAFEAIWHQKERGYKVSLEFQVSSLKVQFPAEKDDIYLIGLRILALVDSEEDLDGRQESHADHLMLAGGGLFVLLGPTPAA